MGWNGLGSGWVVGWNGAHECAPYGLLIFVNKHIICINSHPKVSPPTAQLIYMNRYSQILTRKRPLLARISKVFKTAVSPLIGNKQNIVNFTIEVFRSDRVNCDGQACGSTQEKIPLH